MAVRTFAAETLSYAVCGFIESRLTGFDWSAPDAARVKLKAIEEFAAECSMVKVYASEVLDFVVDEGVQIHGGYGYHQDYLVERAYRDSRINRIFEGTNEINRLLATGMLLKRAMRGQLDLVGAVKRVQAALMEPPSPGVAADACRGREEHHAAGVGRGVRAVPRSTGAAAGGAGGADGRGDGGADLECAALRAGRMAGSSKGEVAADVRRS
jgi:hypothetical protein